MNKTELLCNLCIQDRSCSLNDVYDKLQQMKDNEEERDNYEFLKNIKVRFLNPQGDYDYARLYEIVKVNNEFYLLTNREGYSEFHDTSLSYDDKKGYKYIVKIIYAGIYSYLRDLNGNRIYLYDIVGGYNSDGRYLSGVVTIDRNSGNSFLAVDFWSDWAGGLPMFIGYNDSYFYIRPDTIKVLGQLTFSSGNLGKWPKGFDASEKAYLQGQNEVDKHIESDNNTNIDTDTEQPLSNLDNEKEPQEGFSFKWVNLLIGGAILLALGNNAFTDNWTFYLYLSIVVIIHELGHVIAGKSFGCFIKEMQVFFLPFISYKPEQEPEGSSWRNITWSLGVLPLGGVTVFKSRKSDDKIDVDGLGKGSSRFEQISATSPYIEDKAAWQRLLISAAGVLFNIATFLIIYVALPYMSLECENIIRPLAVLSLFIAVLNILPIYPLDGGSIVFALYEMITGKKPSPSFTNVCSWIGFIFIILFFWIFPEWLNGILDSVFGLFF